jgi:N-acylneuraminate cytidylyltransferase
MNVAIIPARGGSKRISNKNIKNFKGYPLIYWSLKAAISSKLFDKIIVSTDSIKIKNIAEKLKAEVPFLRPKNISNDHASTADVMKHAVGWLEKNNISPKFVCCIYPTAAFLKPKDIIKAYKKIKNSKWDYVFSGGRFTSSIFRSFKKNKHNGLKMIFPKFYNKRTQDITETFHDAGQFYWGKKNSWKKKKLIFSSKSCMIEIPRWRIHDIDNLEDWHAAEKMWILK